VDYEGLKVRTGKGVGEGREIGPLGIAFDHSYRILRDRFDRAFQQIFALHMNKSVFYHPVH
jgi:hypothetical protein